MRPQSAAQKDSSAAVTPPIRPRMPWRVVKARPLDGYRLRVRFVDGLEGEVDMSALVRSPVAGVFARLADSSLFAQVFVEHGAVMWPGEIDLAPDAMHAEIAKQGKWILQ